MSVTPTLGLPYIAAAQAQKHVTHNEALILLDAVVQLAVESRTLTSPPTTPAEGDRYIVASGSTGAWQGHDHAVAVRRDGGWTFITPVAGWLAWVASESAIVVWDNGAWSVATSQGAGMTMLGVNTSADAVN